jgi:hypothetical protein
LSLPASLRSLTRNVEGGTGQGGIKSCKIIDATFGDWGASHIGRERETGHEHVAIDRAFSTASEF